MWGFIALIIIVTIMFGVTLHEAFWEIVGVIAVLFGVGWMFLTDSGKKLATYAIMILGLCVGGFLCYDGISKKTGNEKIYNNDIYSCENDQWRYLSAKVYTGNGNYYYDQNKVNAIGDKYVQDAANNKKNREDWWLIETIAGVIVVGYSAAIPTEIQKGRQAQQPKKR